MKGTRRSSEAEENLDADLRTYRAMLLARRVDEAELQCVGNRQAFFHVSGAVREELPVLFLVEDNAYAISTETWRKTWYSLPGRETDEFYGLPIHRIDGRSPEPCREPLQRCVAEISTGLTG